MNRRDFLKTGLGAASLAALGTRDGLVTRVFGEKATPRKVLILGFDGMDPQTVDLMMSEGKLRNFAKMRQEGSYGRSGARMQESGNGHGGASECDRLPEDG